MKRVVQPSATARARTNLCHIISADLWAGAACQVVNLLSELVKNERYRITAITFNDGKLITELTGFGIEVTCLPEDELSALNILIKICRHVRKGSIDIIHCHGHKEHILGCMAAFVAGRKVKVVRTLHGMPEPYTGMAAIKAQFFQTLQDYVFWFLTHRIIVVSRDMEQRLKMKPWASKMTCIHNGINMDLVKINIPRQEMRNSLDLHGKFVVGAACRLVPIKRLDILLDSFSSVTRRHPDALLVICGDGPLLSKLKEQAERLQIGDRVRFLGHRNDLYDVMSAFNLFVMTSEHEGIPMALLEAIALGLPIIARAIGGIPEIVNGGNATLIKSISSESLSAAISANIDAARELSPSDETNKKTSLPHSAKVTAAETARVYETL